MKEKKYIIILRDAEKTFENIQHLFMIRTFNKLGIKGTCLNIIKAIYDKSKSIITLNVERLNTFKIRNKTRAPTPTTPVQLSTKCPCQSN